MKAQTIFNKTARHLLKQGRKSMAKLPSGAGIGCAYRGREGLQCAVGCHIPNSKYRPTMENKNPSADVVFDALPKIDGMNRDKAVRFWSDLQQVHDDARPRSWAKRLREFAVKHGFKLPAELQQAAKS